MTLVAHQISDSQEKLCSIQLLMFINVHFTLSLSKTQKNVPCVHCQNWWLNNTAFLTTYTHTDTVNDW